MIPLIWEDTSLRSSRSGSMLGVSPLLPQDCTDFPICLQACEHQKRFCNTHLECLALTKVECVVSNLCHQRGVQFSLRRDFSFLLPNTPLSCPPTSHPVLSCLVQCCSGSSSPTPGLPNCFGASLCNAKMSVCVTGSTLPTRTHTSVNICNRWRTKCVLVGAHAVDLLLFTRIMKTCLIISVLSYLFR